MSFNRKKWVFWTPRVGVLAFAAFLSIFALDVFEEGLGFWRTALALVMHLIPVFAVLLVAALAWRWEWVGTVFLTLLGGLHIWFATQRHLAPVAQAAIAGPLFVLAALFLWGWLDRRKPRLAH